jgi:hypothetical protein
MYKVNKYSVTDANGELLFMEFAFEGDSGNDLINRLLKKVCSPSVYIDDHSKFTSRQPGLRLKFAF